MKTLSYHIFSTLVIIAISLSACKSSQKNIENQATSTAINAVDTYVEGVMERLGIPGAAVAVIKNGKTIHENYYGLANIEHQVPVKSKTIFPLLSTTKIPVITAVFKLIEEDKINLGDTIGTYIDDVPADWKSIEIQYLLSHSSGLPDVINYQNDSEKEMKSKVYKDAFVFEKGTQWNYNQTNFWLLARIIEKVTGTTFESHLLNSQFEKENPSVLFSTNMLDIVLNRAHRYTPLNDRGRIEIDKQINASHLNSANGLNISLPEFIKWSKRFEQGAFINSTSKAKMWEKFNFTTGGPAFAYGWEIHSINNHVSYGFSGGYTTAFRTFPEDDLTIIWLTNGFEKSYSTDPVINYIAGIVDEKLQDEKAIVVEEVSQLFATNNLDKALVSYENIRKKYPKVDLSSKLYSIAEGFLRDDKAAESITIFDVLVLEYPKNWTAYYGRANANRNLKNYAKAIEDYRTSATLNNSESDKVQLYQMAKDLEMKIDQ